jgi:rod shape-determining protein MreD
MAQEYPIWRIWLMLIFATTLQTTWLARVQPGGAHIDLLLLTTVSVGIILGWEYGAGYGLAAGLLTGFLAGTNVGSFAISRMIAGGSFGFFDKSFSGDNPMAPPLCAIGAVVLSNFIFLMMSPLDFSLMWWLQQTVARSISHAILIWPLHFLISRYILPPTRRRFV